MTRLFQHRMRLWAFPIIFLACILLAATAGGLQNNAPKSVHNNPSVSAQISGVLDDVAVLWLHVVRDGQLRKQAFSKNDLVRSPILTVDGYVNGAVLLTTRPMQVSVDQFPMDPIDVTKNGPFKSQYFGTPDQDDSSSEIMREKTGVSNSGEIKGRYCRFTQVPGDILSASSEFEIHMDKNGIQYSLTIRQSPPVKLDVSPGLDARAGAPGVYYLGNHPESFSAPRTDFDPRLHAIFSGIRKIETAIGTRLVNQVHIIDFNGPHNAYTCANESNIWIYGSVLQNEDTNELRNIAEHETLHILSDRLGLPTSASMRKLFAQLLGYDVTSQPYNFVVFTGRSLQSNPALQSSPLFDFINEANFIQDAKGGHSQDNIDEFCASFLHTLVYLDRWEQRVDAPLKLRDKSLIKLSHPEKMRLSEDYQTAIDTVMQNMSHEMPAGCLTFFQESVKKFTISRGLVKAQHNDNNKEKVIMGSVDWGNTP